MSNSIKDRIIGKIRRSQEEAIEQKVAQGYAAYEAQEKNSEPDALLAQAVFEFEDKIDEIQSETQKKKIAKLLGRRAAARYGRGGLRAKDVHMQLMMLGLRKRNFSIMREFSDKPGLFFESARGVQLPVDDVEYDREFTFNKQWSIELPYSSRPAGFSYCEIYRQTTEQHSNESGKELVYRIHASRRPYNSATPAYDGEVTSYTDGIEDDPLLTVGKNALEHATSLVLQAIEQVK